jgi:O-antigen/teichoic acid export membrane protein
MSTTSLPPAEAQPTAPNLKLSELPRRLLEYLKRDGERAETQRAAVTAFAVRIASAVLLYASQILLARWLGSAEYGAYVFVWAWVLMLGDVASLGLGYAMLRLIPEYREKQETGLLRGLVRFGRMVGLVSGTLFALLGLAGLWLFGHHLDSHYVLPAYLALVCIPIATLTEIQDGLGRSQGWMTTALVPPFILRPLLLLIGMAMAVAADLPMNAVTAVASAISATWLAAVVQILLINRRFERETPKAEPRFEPRAWLRMSLPLMALAASELALQNTDLLVISSYLTPTDVGIYFAAAKTMSLILFVHFAVGSAVAQRYSALKARGDEAELRAFVKDAVNWTFWPSLAAALILLALGMPLLSLFGSEFTSGYPVMFILVVGFLLRSAVGPVELLLNMLGQQTACATVLVTTAILNVALNLMLVPVWGLTGAALSTATALATAAVANAVVARRTLGIDAVIWHNLPFRAKT